MRPSVQYWLTLSTAGMTALWNVPMENFFVWILWAAAAFLLVGAVTVLFGMVAYRKEMEQILRTLTGKKK